MSAESLVLLCPKTNCFDPRGRGGMGALRPEDIAGALGGLSDRVFLFGLYTVVSDQSVQPQVVYYAHLEVVDLAIARGWRAPAGSMVWRKMALLALCEVIGVDCATCERRRKVENDKEMVAAECPACGRWRGAPEERKKDCAMCEGPPPSPRSQGGEQRGGEPPGDKGKGAAIDCPECGGSGLRRFTTAEREEALEMSGRRWLGRYELAYRRISAWQTTLDDHLRWGLRSEPTDLGMGFASARDRPPRSNARGGWVEAITT